MSSTNHAGEVAGCESSKGDTDDLADRLTPSARRVLTYLRSLEYGACVDGLDTEESRRLREITSLYRGSLYRAVLKHLRRVVRLVGDAIITQAEIAEIVEEAWRRNSTRLTTIEMRVLERIVRCPVERTQHMAKSLGLSYSQVRRARSRLLRTGVLKIQSIMDVRRIGLARVLVYMVQPSFVISSPYLEKCLFIERPQRVVFQVLTIPQEHVSDILALVRLLRGTSSSARVWQLSAGSLQMSSTFYDTEFRNMWSVDTVCLNILARSEDSTLILSPEDTTVAHRPQLLHTDALLLDRLRENLNSTASELSRETDLSESTVFKRRAALIKERGLVIPRARPRIPLLTDRLLLIVEPEEASSCLSAWRSLPVTYVTRITDLENKHLTRILMMASIPRGEGEMVRRRLRIAHGDDLTMQPMVVESGTDERISVAALYDVKSLRWRWEPNDFLDVIEFESAHGDQEGAVPIDLST